MEKAFVDNLKLPKEQDKYQEFFRIYTDKGELC